MRTTRTLLITGIWVALLPYLGIPFFWKNILFSLSGLFLIILSYQFYRESKKRNMGNFDNFRENSDFDAGLVFGATYENEINNNGNA